MMKSIEMTNEDMQEIFANIPEHLKEKLKAKIKPDSGIHTIKNFVEQYDDDHMLDHVMASTISNLFCRVLSGFRTTQEGSTHDIRAAQIGYIILESLKTEAVALQDSLELFEKEDKERAENQVQ